jgi:hypothetical protein
MKKMAIERNPGKRANYIAKIGFSYTAEQLVFVDESSCNRHTTYRSMGYAMKGERAMRKVFFVRGQR